MRRTPIILTPLPISCEQPPSLEVSSRLRPTTPAYAVITMEPAEQHAAPLCARKPQNIQDPTEVGRITHRPFQCDEETLQLSEDIALIVMDIGDIDIG